MGEGIALVPPRFLCVPISGRSRALALNGLISVSAVGSLREHIAPRDIVIPDQLFDRTKSRVNSFYEGGVVVHCPFAEPFCSYAQHKLLLASARELGDVKVHKGGSYVCMEGPLFSTKAESYSRIEAGAWTSSV